MDKGLDALPRSVRGRDALSVAREAVLRAGEVLRHSFQRPITIASKGGRDIVTSVDKEVEREVLSLLRREFPSFGTLSEETPATSSPTPYLWVLDPLDGTRNFAQGIPYFATSLALAVEGEVVLGFIYDPLREDLFQAVRGQGATRNGQALRTSGRGNLDGVVLACDLGYANEEAVWALDLLRSLWPRLAAVRVMGATTLGLASLAAGRVDLYFHPRTSAWDIATGLLLVREAGGEVQDPQGRPASLRSTRILAGSPALLQALRPLLPPARA